MIWKNGYVLGIHSNGSYSGITVAIHVKKLKNYKHSLFGSLLSLSDDEGNFESPIWGIVAQCEWNDHVYRDCGWKRWNWRSGDPRNWLTVVCKLEYCHN